MALNGMNMCWCAVKQLLTHPLDWNLSSEQLSCKLNGTTKGWRAPHAGQTSETVSYGWWLKRICEAGGFLTW